MPDVRPRRVLLGALIAAALLSTLGGAAQAADRHDYQPRPTGGYAQPRSQPRYTFPTWQAKPLRLVVRVIDGDTIDVATRPGATARVRLIGIDAPEQGGRWARQATATLTRMVAGKQVRLEADGSQANRDRYGRVLRYVRMTPHGSNVNQRLIRVGAAREYTYQHRPYRYQRAFKQAERQARAERRGLWGAGWHHQQPPVGHRPVAGEDRDCRHFTTQPQAQSYFEARGGSRDRNVDNLDADRDGMACESLPRA